MLTRNPVDLTRQTGGSSSGSAAGVAARYFPIAFGSQTTSSLAGPSSHCGTVGFKPTYQRLSVEGVQAVSQSLDTLGFLCRFVEDIPLLSSIIIPNWDTELALSRVNITDIRIGIPDGNHDRTS